MVITKELAFLKSPKPDATRDSESNRLEKLIVGWPTQKRIIDKLRAEDLSWADFDDLATANDLCEQGEEIEKNVEAVKTALSLIFITSACLSAPAGHEKATVNGAVTYAKSKFDCNVENLPVNLKRKGRLTRSQLPQPPSLPRSRTLRLRRIRPRRRVLARLTSRLRRHRKSSRRKLSRTSSCCSAVCRFSFC